MTNREAVGDSAPDEYAGLCVYSTQADGSDACGQPAELHLLIEVDGYYSTVQACAQHMHRAIAAVQPEDAHPFTPACAPTGLLQAHWMTSTGGVVGYCLPNTTAEQSQAAMEEQLAEILGGGA